MKIPTLTPCHLLLAGLLALEGACPQAGAVDFSRDVQPILADRCYKCHGPDDDSREAELRLDLRESAVESAILPGDSSGSELVRRITTGDADERMPPIDSHRPPLDQSQIELIRKWIDRGAQYSSHWAFQPPRRRDPPTVDTGEVRNAIDRFLLARLQNQHLEPSRPADRRTLARRLSFDLVGLPPTPDEVQQFADDPSAGSYEKLVDRLLASKHFGERMAM